MRLRATLSRPASCRRRIIRVLRIRKGWTEVVGSASDRIATSSFCPQTSMETSRAMRVDFLAEGVQRNLKELDEPLRQHFEVATGELVGSVQNQRK